MPRECTSGPAVAWPTEQALIPIRQTQHNRKHGPSLSTLEPSPSGHLPRHPASFLPTTFDMPPKQVYGKRPKKTTTTTSFSKLLTPDKDDLALGGKKSAKDTSPE